MSGHFFCLSMFSMDLFLKFSFDFFHKINSEKKHFGELYVCVWKIGSNTLLPLCKIPLMTHDTDIHGLFYIITHFRPVCHIQWLIYKCHNYSCNRCAIYQMTKLIAAVNTAPRDRLKLNIRVPCCAEPNSVSFGMCHKTVAIHYITVIYIATKLRIWLSTTIYNL